MIRKLVCAMFVMAVGVGIIMAKEEGGVITNVKGKKFTFQKREKGKDVGDKVELTLANDGVVAKGNFNKDTKKVEKGDVLEGGLSNKAFADEKGATVRITFEGTTASQILVVGKKKKDAK